MQDLIKRLKEKSSAKREKTLEKRANEMYQIREYLGETWLTYCDRLVLPTSYLNCDYVEVLNYVRRSFVTRNLNNE